MKDITYLKAMFSCKYAKACKECPSGDINNCKKGEACSCIFAAELKAYMHEVIPKGFQDFTVFNFDGMKDEKTLLTREEVVKIKEQICGYCWGIPFKKLKFWQAKDNLMPDRLSIMDDRRDRGDNVVIYGLSSRQVGRTLVASIILREAIKRRFQKSSNVVQTYDWISYDMLKGIAKTPEKLSEYQYCDWLVVDDFSSEGKNSPAAQRYISSVIEPFFATRLEADLPTIMVFRFNVFDEAFEVPGTDALNMFGMAVDRIVRGEGTARICLSEGENG